MVDFENILEKSTSLEAHTSENDMTHRLTYLDFLGMRGSEASK